MIEDPMVRPASAAAPAFELPDVEAEPVFVVDDDKNVLDGLQRFLTKAGYQARAFSSPREALARMSESAPRVLITDKDMPEMTGLELAEKALVIDPQIRVILATGAGDERTAQTALRLGATDYLVKPVEYAELVRAVQRAFMANARDEYVREMDAWLRDELARRTDAVRDLTLGTLDSLLTALEARSPHFKGHSQSVAICAAGIAWQLDLPPDVVASIRTAGLLHDVGMIGVPDYVLHKQGSLDNVERQAIMAHCRKGADILAPMAHLGPSVTFVLEHHERLDGSGYPDGKEADDISMGGQIVGLAEAWTALTERRPYRDRMSRSDAMSTLAAASGKWFSAELLEALKASER